MNRLSMICVTIIMNERKKSGANVDPPLLVSIQSYIILFQSSPVDIENSKEKL